jgi:2'-hydroxyisoflavone reductase
MKPNRRDFLISPGLLETGLAVFPAMSYSTNSKRNQLSNVSILKKTTRPKKILMLGGTGFIGPNMVKYAVDRGHEVSIFTRGNKESEVTGVEHLTGDRNNNLSALKGREWDVVMDNNTYDYRWVQLSTETLKGSVGQYIFVSSISAYDIASDQPKSNGVALMKPIVNEDYKRFSPAKGWKDGDEAEYGLTKALSEDIIHMAFPGRTTIVRPGLIVGPGDRTDRWTYWPVRISEGGEILAPGNPNHANQIIDQRDLTEWIVRLAETGTTGNFNGVGPTGRMSMAQMLYGIWAATGGSANFTWVNEEFLETQGVQPWSDLPSWIPGDPLMFCTNQKSIEAGLTFRPLADTTADTLAWDLARPPEQRQNRRAGINREREKEILAAWKKSG